MRHLYLVGYDVSDSDRQNTVRQQVKTHTFGGQLSAYECLLTNCEKTQLAQFLTKNLTHADTGCIIQIYQTYWQTKPKKMPIFAPTDDFLYIG